MIDYVDRNVPMLAKMFDKRMQGYKAMGYSVDDHAAPDRENNDDVDRPQSSKAANGMINVKPCPLCQHD